MTRSHSDTVRPSARHVDPAFFATYGFCRSVCAECNLLDEEEDQAREKILPSNVIKFPQMRGSAHE